MVIRLLSELLWLRCSLCACCAEPVRCKCIRNGCRVYHKPRIPDLACFGPKRWSGKALPQLFPFQARASHRGEPGAFVHDSGRNLNAQSALCTIPTSDLYEVTIVHRSVFTAPSGVSYARCNGWCHVDSGESRCWIEVTPVARAFLAGALSDSQHEQRRPRRPHSQLEPGKDVLLL